MSADLAAIGLAVLDEQEVHGAAELVIALDHLLDNSGWAVVLLALIGALYRIGMRVVERWQPPRRRAADVGGSGLSGDTPMLTRATTDSPQ